MFDVECAAHILASGSGLTVGEGLESCTHEVNVGLNFELDGRVVILIDTPGFDDTNRSDIDILATIAGYLEKTSVKVLFRRLVHMNLLGNLGIELGRSFQGSFTIYPIFGWVGSRAEISECSANFVAMTP